MKLVSAFMRREVRILARRRNDLVEPLVFYVLGLLLMGMASAQLPSAFKALLPGILWVLGFMAACHALASGWRDELSQGTLAQLLRADAPLALLVFLRIGVAWLSLGLPLSIIGMLAALIFGLPAGESLRLALALLLGLALFCLIGSLVASLAITAGRSSLLIGLLLLPLMSPVLVFGIGASSLSLMDAQSAFLWLAALLALATPLAPLATAFMLRAAEDV